MAKQLDPRLLEILEKYHPNPRSAVWDCHGTLVIYHKAVEVIAASAGIKFMKPEIIVSDQATKHVAILVTGVLGEDTFEWSIGEAAPYNNKNGYPFAMAEKRAKDRVVLKLLGLHGEIYSEDEADDFKNSAPEEVVPDEDIEEILNSFADCNSVDDLQKHGQDIAKHVARLSPAGQKRVRVAFTHRKKTLEAA